MPFFTVLFLREKDRKRRSSAPEEPKGSGMPPRWFAGRPAASHTPDAPGDMGPAHTARRSYARKQKAIPVRVNAELTEPTGAKNNTKITIRIYFVVSG